MTLKRLALGQAGEEAAANYLKKRGFHLLQTNFSCMLGEIDIVAMDGPCMVFVEVRTKSVNSFVLPQESITGKKKRKLKQVASFYLLAKNIKDKPLRFDVIAVSVGPDGQVENIDHIVNAV